ncbi:MAG TPA: hypothetical protein VNL15_06160 [Dehalococcoidia bacterium]|nr:hypothetical protein [Dehalococcoidia bacterium]
MRLDIFDLAGAVGLLSLGAGLWFIYPPAAGIAVGILLLVFAYWGSDQEQKQ